MSSFNLDRKMLTMAGVFYPTGHIMAMLPSESAARAARDALAALPDAGEVTLIDPATVISVIGATARGTDDGGMPSAGTEAATVRHYVDLAKKDHWGLLVRVKDDDEAHRAMDVLQRNDFSYAQRYHVLAIEDIV
jgi:hypothetical protein